MKGNVMAPDFQAPEVTTPQQINATSVSAKLPEDLYTFIENYRWDNRLTKTQVVIDALAEWAKGKGFVPS